MTFDLTCLCLDYISEIFVLEKDAAWRNCIRVKYGIGEEGWFTKHPRGSYGVGLGKAIAKEFDFYKQNSRFKLGNGVGKYPFVILSRLCIV